MKPLTSQAIAAIALLLISGCGGGGGASAITVPNVVNNPNATQALVGGSPLNASSAEIEAAYNRTIRRANTLHTDYHDLDLFYGRIQSNCRGTVCNTRLGAISTGDMLEDLTQINGIPVNYDEDYSPVMTYRGVPIAQARGRLTVPSRPEVSADAQGLGGWLDYSGFSIAAAALYDGPREEGYFVAYVDHSSVGISPRTRPELGVTGTVTWEGAMVAADTEFRHAIIGASTVQLDLARMNADVQMTNVTDIDAGTRLPSFGWTNVPVDADGTFGNGRTLEASFYGPNHEETAGIFTTRTLIGSFGAKRQ